MIHRLKKKNQVIIAHLLLCVRKMVIENTNKLSNEIRGMEFLLQRSLSFNSFYDCCRHLWNFDSVLYRLDF